MLTTDGWRAPILQHFSSESAQAGRLTVVHDPDNLLSEPGVAQCLTERGFEIVFFSDPIAFRYEYESRFRQRWDVGERSHLVVVTQHDPNGEMLSLPHDILSKAQESRRVLSFGLRELFPSLVTNVVAELDRQYLAVLGPAVELDKKTSWVKQKLLTLYCGMFLNLPQN